MQVPRHSFQGKYFRVYIPLPPTRHTKKKYCSPDVCSDHDESESYCVCRSEVKHAVTAGAGFRSLTTHVGSVCVLPPHFPYLSLYKQLLL